MYIIPIHIILFTVSNAYTTKTCIQCVYTLYKHTYIHSDCIDTNQPEEN